MSDDDNPERECRCCRKPVDHGLLACFNHWMRLPTDLRASIRQEYKAKRWREYAAEVRKADAIWQALGIWKPGVAKTG